MHLDFQSDAKFDIVLLTDSEFDKEYDSIKDFKIPDQKLDKFWYTSGFYKGNVSNKDEIKKNPLIFIKQLKCFAKKFTETSSLENLLREDIKNLFNIYVHEINYHKIGTKIRKYTMCGMVALIKPIIIAFIIALVFLFI